MEHPIDSIPPDDPSAQEHSHLWIPKQAALAYARRGWPVFPLHTPGFDGCSCGLESGCCPQINRPGHEPREVFCSCAKGAACPNIGKHPRTAHGLKDATTDADTIDAWWSQWFDANIGLVTGKASGFIALDIDPYHAGDITLEDLEAEHGQLSDTVEQHTGGGGRHFLFKHPGGLVRNDAGKKLGAGLDIRGDGGYIVAAPSVHVSGRRYEWEATSGPNDIPLAAVSGWLLTLIQAPSATSNGRAEDAGAPIADGQRDVTLTSLAGTMRRRGMTPKEIYAALNVVNNERCEPPLEDAQVRKIAESIGRYAPGPANGSASAHTGPEDGQTPPADPPPAAVVLPLSDLTNAETLVRWHGQDLRYCHPTAKWYVHRKTHWKPDATAEVMRRAKQTIKRLAARIENIEDDEKAAAWLNHIKKSLSVARLKGMVELASSEETIPILPEQLDADPWLLNCLNGTIDLRTGKLRAHRQEDLITKLCPVHYDPKARSALWESFLEKALPDVEVRDFVQRATGYSSSGDISEEKLFFAYGPTGTGKSTLLAAIGATLGDYVTTADFESFLVRERLTGGPRNDIARLAGKRFVVSLEVDDGKHLAEALIKQLTGGDIVAARFLYHESFEFLPTFKLWLAANHRPIVRDDDDAVWRRILQIPFMVQIPKADQDPTIKARLRNPAESGAAILAWIVEGCLAWQREGLKVPTAVEKTTEEYRQQMDPLSEFLDERCVCNPTAYVLKTRLLEAYQEWARTRGHRRVLGRKDLTERLRKREFDEGRKNTGEIWIGLKLR